MKQFHEDYGREQPIEGSSERGFGLVFAVVFAVIGLWPLRGEDPVRWWALGTAAAFLIVAFVYPRILWPLNWVWTRFGILLGRIVAPIVMGIVFFVVITPIALIRRLMGKDSLHLEFDPEAESYWVVRKPPGPDPKSMPRQF